MFLREFVFVALLCTAYCQINPTILQDTRDLPKLDGTFGFLYRTEDGIAHAAKADPGGTVHGRFTYTDPTGLKVNYNYNAGSGVTPKIDYNAAPVAAPAPAPTYQEQPAPTYQEQRAPAYQEQPRRTRPPAARNYEQYDNNVNDNRQYYN